MKPNILFIGPIKQFCGWGQASKDYVRALSTVANVTVRNVYLSNQKEKQLPPDLQPLENTQYDHYDIVIQKVLPNLYHYDGRFSQNIGMMVFETELTNHSWFNNMNLMDKILVPSYFEKQWLQHKVKSKVFNIGEPLDISIADKEHPAVEPVLKDKNVFKFLFIGESIPRKGIKELIQAYFAEFSINDNVLLVLKTSADITQDINQIKAIMRKFLSDTRYPPIYLIPNRLSNTEIYGLQQNCDAFVMPSFGEAFNRPAATSLVFGKPVIATKNTGMNDYLSEDIGWLIDSSREQVFCATPPMPDLYTSKEIYYVPNILSLRECLREAYSDKELYKKKSSNIAKTKIAESFSYEKVGQEILKAINA